MGEGITIRFTGKKYNGLINANNEMENKTKR